MEVRDFFNRVDLLNLPELRRQRSDWTDRLPRLQARPSAVARDLVRWHWSFLVPAAVHDAYMLWLARRRYALNIEQIERDELDELVASDDDGPGQASVVYERHTARRVTARFFVATVERRRLERLARRWDVDAKRMIARGEADEAAIAQARRAVREARWTFVEQCAKLLIPILSLLVALAALAWRHP